MSFGRGASEPSLVEHPVISVGRRCKSHERHFAILEVNANVRFERHKEGSEGFCKRCTLRGDVVLKALNHEKRAFLKDDGPNLDSDGGRDGLHKAKIGFDGVARQAEITLKRRASS